MQKVDAPTFRAALVEAKEQIGQQMAWRVETKSVEEYQKIIDDGGALYKSEMGSTIGVTNSGEIISFCRVPIESDKLSAKDIFNTALKNNGKYFDCYVGVEDFFLSLDIPKVKEVEWDEKKKTIEWKVEYGKENVAYFDARNREQVLEISRDVPLTEIIKKSKEICANNSQIQENMNQDRNGGR